MTAAIGTAAAAGPENRITILCDAFGKDTSMQKDWGFSALVEIAGKRILFDTGDDRDIFAANVKAKNGDLTKLDFVVLSHRHSDHMAGLAHVLSVSPKVKIYAPKEGFGIYGSSLPSSFYRKQVRLIGAFEIGAPRAVHLPAGSEALKAQDTMTLRIPAFDSDRLRAPSRIESPVVFEAKAAGVETDHRRRGCDPVGLDCKF
jgi:glyoxylase-like metal-dependent hydrolase (beta-lactamase superfamily II)